MFVKDIFIDLKKMKENIVLQFITKEELKTLQEKVNVETNSSFPYRKWNDLFIVCKSVIYELDSDLITTIPITNALMQNLHFTEEELFLFAKENTPKVAGVIVVGLNHVNKNHALLNKNLWEFPKDKHNPIRVIDHFGLGGAVLILCDGIMDKLSEHYQTDILYVLPASKAHVIIFPNSDIADEERLKNLLYETNRSELKTEIPLSDNVYKYICETKEFEIV